LQDSPIYGVYSDYESDFMGHYNLTAGVAVSAKSSDFETVEVQEGTYMVFESKGAMPQVIIDTWGKIWQFFHENPNVKRKYTTDFEIYQRTDEIRICIAIEE
jgi:predicted transcriptional regulator YdeE